MSDIDDRDFFHPGDDWIDFDPEWDEIAPWLLQQVIDDFITEVEAGDYI